jgi:hypothetical protein
LTALIVAGALAGTSSPAQAMATTEQIRALAANGQGQPITLGGPAAEGRDVGDGVVVSPMVTGLISGRTTQTGWWPVVVTARDAAGSTASASFKWIVKNDGCAKC